MRYVVRWLERRVRVSRWMGATPAERRTWGELLAGVMRASRAGDDDVAVILLRDLGRTLGAEALVGSLEYLAERAATPWLTDATSSADQVIGVVVQGADGRELDIEQVPYPLRWSARMVAAAANRDSDTQRALMLAALEDGRLGSCLAILAQMAAAVPVEGSP
ncbi:hypothetical protein AGRA3207_000216 [Actinomadura graeca]|uniref:Uncharacterized protein n=1 Tax=Actinomadura graeca TaxID=2750812 RepID=A0ABX8QMB2_9ACTN|nr:hypothetical protein [Actinomadura graeca]QXJ19653.1 hypothetical protein AGRA3207_000216 [Actinomadura graeca]